MNEHEAMIEVRAMLDLYAQGHIVAVDALHAVLTIVNAVEVTA